MPFIKVNLNGRKYVISGLTERTSSKHILCLLARVDSTFHLETTDLSDTSLEIDESKKGVRSSRSRMRHTRERHSSTSSVEITKWKKCLRGVVSEKSCLIHECVNGTTKRQEWKEENNKSKCSRKLLFKETTNEREKQILESKTELSKNKQETSSEDQLEERSGEGKEKEKGEVKRRRKMKTKKRPVSQDMTSWKEKNESNENGEKTKLGGKGWKSADDVIRGKKCSHFLSCEKMDEKMKRNKKPTHNRKPKHLHCHKRDKHRNIVADVIDNKPSEYRRVHRHVRQELNNIKIQKLVSRAVDQRLVDLHVACLQSSQRTHTSVKQNQNEEETKRKLIQLINSQRKCLTALSKADKQIKKSINRYKRYLDLDKENIHFCNANLDRENFARERERNSDTEHDTGISEQHSDSSTENKQMTSYDVFKYDDKFNYVICDDVIRSDEALESKESKTADSLLTGEDAKTCESMLKIDNSKTYDISKSDVIIDGVASDDVINSQDLETRNIITDDLSCDKAEDVAKMDGTLHDDVINDVELDDFTQSVKDVIIATQTEVVPFDQSEISSTTVPCCSACSITTSTVSEMSDYCCYSNPIDSYPRDIQGCQEVLMKEEARELKLKQTIDRMSGEMRLMDLRMLEQNKMADILESLKNLNTGLEKDNKETEPDKQDLQQEKKNLKQSIKLSKNLYEYQKGEMKDNAVSLQIIESQIKRKRWHVESAVKDLGQFVTRSLRTQLERIQSLEEVTGITTSVAFKPQLNGTLV